MRGQLPAVLIADGKWAYSYLESHFFFCHENSSKIVEIRGFAMCNAREKAETLSTPPFKMSQLMPHRKM